MLTIPTSPMDGGVPLPAIADRPHPPRHRRGRTRIWDDVLAPRPAMSPNNPENWIDALLDTFLHPVKAMRDQLHRGAGWAAAPWRLWVALAVIAVVGSLIYGASLALALPANGWLYAAIALAASAGAGWVLFGIVLIGMTRRPAPHLAHACLVTMMFGEAVLELGVIANLIFRDGGAPLALNIGIVAVSNVVMFAVMAGQLRVLGIRPIFTATLWFGILNPAAIAVFRLFYPELFPF